jgi:hypothetical protein
MMMNVGFIQNGNNVKTGHKNSNNACVRDMQIDKCVNDVVSDHRNRTGRGGLEQGKLPLQWR